MLNVYGPFIPACIDSLLHRCMNLLLRKLPTAKRVHGCRAARPSEETIDCMQGHIFYNYNAE